MFSSLIKIFSMFSNEITNYIYFVLNIYIFSTRFEILIFVFPLFFISVKIIHIVK